MKQFFEQYGAVALGILALLVLIAMITPVGNIIKTSLQGTVQTFSTKMDGQVDTMTESMNAAIINATSFDGIKDGKLFVNGKVPSHFKDATILPSNCEIQIGETKYRVVWDLNVVVLNDNSLRAGGIPGLTFNILIDGTEKDSNVSDWGCTMDLSKEHTFEAIPVNIPENIEVVETGIKTNYELLDIVTNFDEEFMNDHNKTAYITYPIYVRYID